MSNTMRYMLQSGKVTSVINATACGVIQRPGTRQNR